MNAETISVQHAEDEPLRHVALRIDGLLGGERQLLDREEQPDREGQRREHAAEAERAATDRCRPAARRAPSGPTPMLSAQREKSHSGIALIQKNDQHGERQQR